MQQVQRTNQTMKENTSGQLFSKVGRWTANSERGTFIMPAIIIVLFFSIFPLIISAYLSLSRLQFVRGGFELNFVGWQNYDRLLFGREQRHFLGKLENPGVLGWFIFLIVVGFILFSIYQYITSGSFKPMGLFWRLVASIGSVALAYLLIHALGPEGLPGTLVVTLIFVFFGIAFQYGIGLGLALLTTQNLPGQRFFRIIFLLPMMITPVGIAYMFRMLTDTAKGPIKPLWVLMGLSDFTWVTSPIGARTAVLIGDIWQWTPFMFIVLLAALEGRSDELVEAALVDGANKIQIFRYVIWPQILPVSLTLIFIRLIEAFKIIDMPQVMLGGGPGTATESLVLHAYVAWRALDLGGSAAVAYLLLFVVTFISLTYVHLVRNRLMETL